MTVNHAASLKHLNENIQKLNYRYAELVDTDRQFYEANIERRFNDHAKIQSEFVNKVEAFHQQIYVVISSLIRVLASIKHPSVLGVKINSCQNFLHNLLKNNSQLTTEIQLTLSSVQYRADFIDHPQIKPLHDWWTCTIGENKNNIIHFRKLKNNETFADIQTLYPNTTLIENFQKGHVAYIPQKYDDVYNAVFSILCNLLEGTPLVDKIISQ